MKKSCKMLLIFAVTLVTSATFSRASDSEAPSQGQPVPCSCIFNGTKDYQLFDETKSVFGKRKVHRKWTCGYTCDVGSVTETVTGSYEMTNYGDDNGREGICEGTVYVSEFNQSVMRELYTYKSSEYFRPRKAKAAELKQWAEKHGCDSGAWYN